VGCKGEVIWAKKQKLSCGGSVVTNETWGAYNAVVGTHLGWGKLGLKGWEVGIDRRTRVR